MSRPLFDHEIIENLTIMRTSVKERITKGENIEDIKLAFCGKCYYTKEIREYQEKHFYPYCECHDYINGTNKIMIFDTIDETNKLKRSTFMLEQLRKIYDEYINETVRLQNLYSGFFNYVYNFFTLRVLCRYVKIKEIINHQTEISLVVLNESMKNSNYTLKSMNDEVTTFHNTNIEDIFIKEQYKILGFYDLTELPTEVQIKDNYRSLISILNSTNIDTSQVQKNINFAYADVCKYRKFNIDPFHHSDE